MIQRPTRRAPGSRALSWDAVSVILLAAVLAIAIATSTHAAEGGGSHYSPGFYGDFGVALAPDPGFALRNDFYYYSGDASGRRVVQNGELRADIEADTYMYMATGLMTLDKEFLGGRYAFGAFLPVLSSSVSGSVVLDPLDADPETVAFDASRTGFSDLGLIPASIFWNAGNFHFNAYEVIIVPTGSYNVNRDVNTGLNYWSFDTVLATTWFQPDRGHEVSAVLGYIFNTENSATEYKTGQEFHLDYMLNQFFSETFALGLHGFYYKQVTGDSGSGALLGDFKGEGAGIGPAAMLATKAGDTDIVISARWIHEFLAEHRLEGNNFYLSLTLAF